MVPFHRLPRLVQEEVVRNMEILDILNLSNSSLRTFRVLQQILKYQQFSIEMYVGIYLYIAVHRGQKSFRLECFPMRNAEELGIPPAPPKYFFRGIRYSKLEDRTFGETYLKTYCDDPQLNLWAYQIYFTGLFGKPVDTLKYVVREDHMYFGILEQITCNQPTIKDVYISLHLISETNIKKALDILKNVDNMKWGIFILNNEKSDFRNIVQRFEYDYLHIVSAFYWLSLSLFMNMNCRILRIQSQFNLTHADMNVYLRSWMVGLLPKLERVTLYFENLDLSIILDGIECKTMPVKNKPFDKKKGRYEIQRATDGKKAIVFGGLTRVPQDADLHGTFEMIVLKE